MAYRVVGINRKKTIILWCNEHNDVEQRNDISSSRDQYEEDDHPDVQ